MAKKVPYHNSTSKTVYIGGISVFAMQTRMVDEEFLEKEDSPSSSAVKFELKTFLNRNVGDVAADVHSLDDEQLQAVLDAESEGKKRVGVLSACTDEMESRHNSDEATKQAFRDQLEPLNGDELQQRLLAENLDPLELELIQELLSERKSGSDGESGTD